MGKRFKLRLPSFQSCKSKDPSDLPVVTPVFFRVSPLNPKFVVDSFPPPPHGGVTPQPSKSHHHHHHHHHHRSGSITRKVSSAIVSVGCSRRRRSKSADACVKTDESTESLPNNELFRWQKEEKWHVVAKVQENTRPRRKIYTSSASEGEINNNNNKMELKKKKKVAMVKKNTKSRFRVRLSTSSGDQSGWFSSEGGEEDDDVDEESETLVSSSSEYDCRHLETIRESPINDYNTKKKKKKIRAHRKSSSSKMVTCPSPETYSPARLSVFQKLLPCKVEGKVKESFAVVKKSEDPYEDFRRSMLEMILEKEMFEPSDLEQLLHCFLSLNSRHHHTIIVEAFSEIWELLFSG